MTSLHPTNRYYDYWLDLIENYYIYIYTSIINDYMISQKCIPNYHCKYKPFLEMWIQLQTLYIINSMYNTEIFIHTYCSCNTCIC